MYMYNKTEFLRVHENIFSMKLGVPLSFLGNDYTSKLTALYMYISLGNSVSPRCLKFLSPFRELHSVLLPLESYDVKQVPQNI